MYVCSCRVVTSCAVKDAIAAGAASIDDIAQHCGAGSRCGGCWPTLSELLGSLAPAQRTLVDAG
jgi:bacterioferritin-associated ferredoxin